MPAARRSQSEAYVTPSQPHWGPRTKAVLTLADISSQLSNERLPLQFRGAKLPPDITPFVLAKDEVAYVGEAVALVIADSRYLAEDATAMVHVDYEILPAVSDCRIAAEPGAVPRVHLKRMDGGIQLSR